MKLISFNTIFLILLYLSIASPLLSEVVETSSPQSEHKADKNNLEQKNSLIQMGEIVVTGTIMEREISDSPILTQTVNENQLRKSSYLHVGDALENAPGIYVQNDSIGGAGYLKSLNIQGMDRRRVLILVNGNPIFGSYAGRMNLANFSVGGIERIEVIKGPLSSLYGSGAIGGVVNIITKGSKKPIEYSTSLTYRSDPKWNNSLLWSHRFGISRAKTSAALNFGINSNDGYYLRNDEGKTASTALQVGYDIGGELKHKITPQLSINTEGQFTIIESQMRGLNLSSFKNLDVQRYFIQPNIRYSLENIADFKLSFYSTQYYHENYSTYVEYGDRIKSIEDLESRPFEAIKNLTGFKKSGEPIGLIIQNEKLERFDFLANGKKKNLLWVVGANVGQMGYETDNISGGPKDRSEQSAFTQMEWLLPTRTSIIGGLRYEHSDAYGSDLSPKLAIMQKKEGLIKEDDSVALRFSFAKGYRAPDFKELYYDIPYSTKGMSIIGAEYLREFAPWEPRLKPERSIGINVGPEYFWSDKIRIHFNLFWNELWDAIRFKTFDKTSKTYQTLVRVFPQGIAAGEIADPTESEYTKTSVNVDQARTYGTESYFSIRLHGWFGTFSYTYIMAKDNTNNIRLENVPKDILKIRLERILVFGSSFALTPCISYRYIHGELSGKEEQPDIYSLDGNVSLIFGNRFVAILGVNNITDQKDIKYLRQLPGRMIYITNNFSF